MPDAGMPLDGAVGGTCACGQLGAPGGADRWSVIPALVEALGLDALRYGHPYYRTHIGPTRYEWDIADAPMLRLEELGIEVIADLRHFGVPSWRDEQWREVMRLRSMGIPLRGFTWYSLTDQIDWQHGLRVERNEVYPVGLFDLDRRIRPVGRGYRSLVMRWRPFLATSGDGRQLVCGNER